MNGRTETISLVAVGPVTGDHIFGENSHRPRLKPSFSLPPSLETLALNGSLCQDDIFANDGLISGKRPDKKTASTSRNIQRPNIVVFVSHKICIPISIGSCERLRAG